jgi:hypothetical protein
VLTYWQCDSTTRADEIKDLFVRNDRPGFPHFFERVYRTLAAEGGMSWIATDEEGKVVMHVALFPRSFQGDGTAFRVGLLGDLIADVQYRDFWSPLKLFRRAIGDIRRDGRFDFLYTDPSPNSVAIVKAVGFSPLGELRRYVAPVNPLYLTFCGVRARAKRSRSKCHGKLDATGAATVDGMGGATDLRARRSAEFYRAREGGDLAPHAQYVLVQARGGGDTQPSAVGMLAVRDGADTAALVDLQWDESRLAVKDALHAVARAARSQGFRKLSCATLDGSHFAESLASYGFIGREAIQPIFVLPLRASSALPRAPEWMLTSLDGSAW